MIIVWWSSMLCDFKYFMCLLVQEARNASLAVGMCPQSQWEKVTKGSRARSMSPFDHKFLDIRTAGATLENFKVSTDEEIDALMHELDEEEMQMDELAKRTIEKLKESTL
ncbi:uncharacterized protein LOC130720807 [Lotus japonicus]|uniref:uncharacterized protein LOC130720807 n=1 Tax=Lotus japonicus TaxID=34305 RepID=UPI00258DBE93|nr:uncharacterized protein LOC130720807 [Lotus japonicus]